MLINRSTEMKFLDNYHQMPESQMVIVYGQKNMGKTTLIQEFTHNKPSSTYYLARSCSSREQRFQWSRELRHQGKELPRYPEYKEIFPCLIKDGKEVQEKQLILLDEFHHMVKGDGSFMSELTTYMQNRSKEQPVLIILCTSAMGWVENGMVRKLGTAAFSLKGLLKVKEFKFEYFRKYFHICSWEDCVRTYAVIGGIPGLWNSFDVKKSVKENIIRNVLMPSGKLYDVMSLLIAEELRETGVYNTILAAMAGGCNKLNEIYLHTGFSRAKISVYLKNLMELELVEKVFSYETDGRANAQKGIYRIANPFVRFYFYFIYPDMSSLTFLTPEEYYAGRIEKKLDSYSEEAFKKVCREHFEMLQVTAKLPFSYVSIGEWVGKAGSLDIVARDHMGSAFVAYCSYGHKVTNEDYERLLSCAQKARIKPSYAYLYTMAGFDERLVKAAEEEPSIVLIDMGKE